MNIAQYGRSKGHGLFKKSMKEREIIEKAIFSKKLSKLERKLKLSKSRGNGLVSRISELKLENLKKEKFKEIEEQMDLNDLNGFEVEKMD